MTEHEQRPDDDEPIKGDKIGSKKMNDEPPPEVDAPVEGDSTETVPQA